MFLIYCILMLGILASVMIHTAILRKMLVDTQG